MTRSIRGQCHCKKIHYEVTPPTDFFSHCHCESCRKIHGAAFVSWTSVPNNQLRILTGENFIHRYESSPEIIWMSCGKCSSSLFQTTKQTPGKTYVNISNLIDPMDRPAESHVSFEEKVPWLEIKDTLPQYKEKSSTLY